MLVHLLKVITTIIIVYSQLNFYTALSTLIICVLPAYAVWRYKHKHHRAPSVNDKVESSRISLSWTTQKWSSMTAQSFPIARSPELILHNTWKWYLEVRPVNESAEAGLVLQVSLIVRNISALGFLWDRYGPLKTKQPVETSFKISVSREKLRKDNHSCEDGGVDKNIESVVVEDTVLLKCCKNIFGPFVLSKEVIHTCNSLDIPFTFTVEIFNLGRDDSKSRSGERMITKEIQGTENDVEELIDQHVASTDLGLEGEKPESTDPEVVSDSLSDAEMELRRLRDTLKEVLGRREFCDVKIAVSTRIFHAHKAILAVRCPNIINNISADENCVTLEGVDPDVFGVVLEFMYACEIEEGLLGLISGDLLKAAVQLKMEDLKTLAEKSLLKTLNSTNAAELVQIAYECDSTTIKEPILQFISAHKKEILASPEWRSVRRCPYSKEILFDLLNTF